MSSVDSVEDYWTGSLKAAHRPAGGTVTLRLVGSLPCELQIDGRSVPVPRSLDRAVPQCHGHQRRPGVPAAPIDGRHFYVRRISPAEAAAAAGLHRLEASSGVAGDAVFDPLVAQLGICLLAALDEADEVAAPLVACLALALQAHIVGAYGGAPPASQSARGRLAPWQERRAKRMLEENLAGEVTVVEVAAACGLSLGHFSRAFKQTAGQSPHRWHKARRIEQAKRLLLTTNLPLAEIAPACGFADQSHFTRVFSQMVGSGPGTWRRACKP